MEHNHELTFSGFRSGNYTPVSKQVCQELCEVDGIVPNELTGGQYVRNSSNPINYGDKHRPMHWFDGHGMLNSVLFWPTTNDKECPVLPLYSNQYVLTDVYLNEAQKQRPRGPLVPSMATLLSPATPSLAIVREMWSLARAVVSSWLNRTSIPIKRISVANTNIIYHDGRALATCESGPPIRIHLPTLRTVGWFNGRSAEGNGRKTRKSGKRGSGFTTPGLRGFFHEWTTAHVSKSKICRCSGLH